MMQKGVLVYISGPISETDGFTVEMNVGEAVKVFCNLTRMGIPSICPHLGAAFPSCHKIGYRVWMAYDLAVIDYCTHMLMLPRWTESRGAAEEMVYAGEKGIPIVYSTRELAMVLEKSWSENA